MTQRGSHCAARLLLLTLGWLAIVPVAPAVARAKDETAKQQARSLFRQGNALLNSQDYAAALDRFRRAAELFPSFKIDLNIATTLTLMGQLAEAALFYDRFLQRGERAPAAILAAARAKLDELKAKVAMVRLDCPVRGALVELDARSIGRTPIDHTLYVMPGPAQLTVTKEGYQRFLATLSLSPGESKALSVKLEPEPQEESRPPPPALDHGAAGASGSPEVDGAAAAGSWRKTTGWITLAVGGAALVTGVIFSGMAAAKASQHDEAVEDRKEYEIVKQLADDNQRLKTVQVVTLVTGGVAAAAGGALLLWHHLGDRRRAAGGERALVPLIAGDAAGASLVGRF